MVPQVDPGPEPGRERAAAERQLNPADALYRRKGRPPPAFRALEPVLVGLTAIVFATGVALLIGPSSRGTLVLVHKVSFICWVVVTAVHIAGHLPELLRFNRVSRRTRAELGELRSLVPGFGGAAEPPVDGPIPRTRRPLVVDRCGDRAGAGSGSDPHPGLRRVDQRSGAVSSPPPSALAGVPATLPCAAPTG